MGTRSSTWCGMSRFPGPNVTIGMPRTRAEDRAVRRARHAAEDRPPPLTRRTAHSSAFDDLLAALDAGRRPGRLDGLDGDPRAGAPPLRVPRQLLDGPEDAAGLEPRGQTHVQAKLGRRRDHVVLGDVTRPAPRTTVGVTWGTPRNRLRRTPRRTRRSSWGRRARNWPAAAIGFTPAYGMAPCAMRPCTVDARPQDPLLLEAELVLLRLADDGGGDGPRRAAFRRSASRRTSRLPRPRGPRP